MTQKRKKADVSRLQTMMGDIGHAVSLERLGPKFTERVLWKVDTDRPVTALTFDDGPHPTATPKILEILDGKSIPATFFLVGKHLSAQRETAEAVLEAGHEIANHTYNHHLLLRLNEKQIRSEILKTDLLLRELTGLAPKFLRPPSGLFNRRVLDIADEMGYRVVVGDVYPRDPHRPGTERIVRRVLDRATKGSIIILHDGGNTGKVDRTQTQEALHEIIEGLQDSGFQFVTLSELIRNQGKY